MILTVNNHYFPVQRSVTGLSSRRNCVLCEERTATVYTV